MILYFVLSFVLASDDLKDDIAKIQKEHKENIEEIELKYRKDLQKEKDAVIDELRALERKVRRKGDSNAADDIKDMIEKIIAGKNANDELMDSTKQTIPPELKPSQSGIYYVHDLTPKLNLIEFRLPLFRPGSKQYKIAFPENTKKIEMAFYRQGFDKKWVFESTPGFAGEVIINDELILKWDGERRKMFHFVNMIEGSRLVNNGSQINQYLDITKAIRKKDANEFQFKHKVHIGVSGLTFRITVDD